VAVVESKQKCQCFLCIVIVVVKKIQFIKRIKIITRQRALFLFPNCLFAYFFRKHYTVLLSLP
jgi:hypothetical protein